MPSQRHAQAGASSLVQYNSITYTAPSDIAKDSLLDLLSLPTSDPRRIYDGICSEFVEYLDRSEQKGFMVKGYDTRKGEIINLPMSYDNRWGESRRRELSEKLKRLEWWFDTQQDNPVTMITLTSYHDGMNISQAWHELNKSRGKLLKLIAKYFPGADYFWVPEPHKSGYVHYHLAVFADVSNNVKDKKGKGIEDKFRDLWSRKYKTGNHTYGLDFSQKKGDGKIQHLKNYLSKYLEKGFLLDKWSIGMLLFNAHLWETGFRMYGASKNIRAIMNIKDEKDSPIVWLETKMETHEITPEGEEVNIEKVIWARLYIPDWIDSSMWLDIRGNVRLTDPPPQYLYDWGRSLDASGGHYPVMKVEYDEKAARRARALASQDWSD